MIELRRFSKRLLANFASTLWYRIQRVVPWPTEELAHGVIRSVVRPTTFLFWRDYSSKRRYPRCCWCCESLAHCRQCVCPANCCRFPSFYRGRGAHLAALESCIELFPFRCHALSFFPVKPGPKKFHSSRRRRLPPRPIPPHRHPRLRSPSTLPKLSES